ncbi:MAG: SDR family oxidoreductase [Trebonia sp.]
MQTDVVTGAFGYSGAAIARELRAAGHQVRTLTGHPRAGSGAGDTDTRPLNFGDPEAIVKDLAGAQTLYCTYWVRFPHGTSTRESAVANSKTLFDAAARAGVARIVYISILHADIASPYPYFSGKAEVERHLAATGVPYAIARPSILFGSSDGLGSAASVLVNNIAWLLRHLPAFGIGDGGGYRIRPIEVDDLARLCVELAGRADNVTVDAVGPDAPTFLEMVTAIRSATGSRALLVPTPGWLIPPLSAVLGAALRDVLLTKEEYQAMKAGLATSDAPSTGQASLMDWIAAHGDELGRTYANELDRHYRRARSLTPGLSSRPVPHWFKRAPFRRVVGRRGRSEPLRFSDLRARHRELSRARRSVGTPRRACGFASG